MSENGEIYTAGKNFTLPPALTGWTNSTSALTLCCSSVQTPRVGSFVNLVSTNPTYDHT